MEDRNIITLTNRNFEHDSSYYHVKNKSFYLIYDYLISTSNQSPKDLMYIVTGNLFSVIGRRNEIKLIVCTIYVISPYLVTVKLFYSKITNILTGFF
jgi:hypothetical protein